MHIFQPDSPLMMQGQFSSFNFTHRAHTIVKVCRSRYYYTHSALSLVITLLYILNALEKQARKCAVEPKRSAEMRLGNERAEKSRDLPSSIHGSKSMSSPFLFLGRLLRPVLPSACFVGP
jgi:hypothetical protein